MNETKKIFSRIEAQRKELPAHEEYVKSKKTGKDAKISERTKGQVEAWCKNVRHLSDDLQKQLVFLGNLGNANEIGGNGGGAATSNYMNIIVKRLQKDVEDLMKVCQLTMVLDVKKIATDQRLDEEQIDSQWILMRKSIRAELNKVDVELNQTSYEDRFKNGYVVIAKLLNMRDIIQK